MKNCTRVDSYGEYWETLPDLGKRIYHNCINPCREDNRNSNSRHNVFCNGWVGFNTALKQMCRKQEKQPRNSKHLHTPWRRLAALWNVGDLWENGKYSLFKIVFSSAANSTWMWPRAQFAANVFGIYKYKAGIKYSRLPSWPSRSINLFEISFHSCSHNQF